MSEKRQAADKKGTRRSTRIMDNEAASRVSGWSSHSLVTVRREELITPKNRRSARRGYKELHTYSTPQDLVKSAAEMMKTWARPRNGPTGMAGTASSAMLWTELEEAALLGLPSLLGRLAVA